MYPGRNDHDEIRFGQEEHCITSVNLEEKLDYGGTETAHAMWSYSNGLCPTWLFPPQMRSLPSKPISSFLHTIVPGYLDHFSQTVLISRHELVGTHSAPSLITLCRIILGSILKCRPISRTTNGPE